MSGTKPAVNTIGRHLASFVDQNAHAFRWTPSEGMTDLGFSPASSRGGTADGATSTLATDSGVAVSGLVHPWRWEAATGWVSLGASNSSGGVNAMNATGEIVGSMHEGLGPWTGYASKPHGRTAPSFALDASASSTRRWWAPPKRPGLHGNRHVPGASQVGDPGLEPGTSSLSEKRSNRLS